MSLNLLESNTYCSVGGQITLSPPASITKTCITNADCNINLGTWTTTQGCTDLPELTYSMVDSITG